MFWGKCSISDVFQNKTILFENIFEKNQNIHQYNITFNDFHGFIFLSSLLPYKIDDYLLIDNKNNILLIVYGNIYNKTVLCKNHHLQNEITQLELIQYLFLKEGTDFVSQLNGDFVIFIYQPDQNTFYLFRDHLGIQPLAYTFRNNSIIFSSDIINLCRVFQEDESINIESLLSAFRFADLTQTPNKKIKKLLPGHYLKCTNQEIRITKYWEPEKINTNRKLKYNQVINELSALVEDAIHIRSDKRFNAAAHVSSGLDSGVVAALARKEYNHQELFYGYSWSPTNFVSEKIEFDERELVKQICSMNNIIPVFINLNADDYENLSKNYKKNFGYFFEEKILDHVQKEHVNLIFSGWGGDEFISKGERGINSDLLFNLNWNLFFKRNPVRKLRAFLRILLYDVLLPAIQIVNFSQQKVHREYTRYLKIPFNKNHYPSVKKFLFYTSRRQLHLGFLYHYHIPERTGIWYVNGFSKGVEYRYPLLDKRIVEYMLTVPSKLLIKGTYSRIVLREISKGLVPEEVRWLRKGIDPVIVAVALNNYHDSAIMFINKINEFKANPDLFFIDFDLIEEDIRKFKNSNKYHYFFTLNMITINMLHEFTKSYRL